MSSHAMNSLQRASLLFLGIMSTLVAHAAQGPSKPFIEETTFRIPYAINNSRDIQLTVRGRALRPLAPSPEQTKESLTKIVDDMARVRPNISTAKLLAQFKGKLDVVRVLDLHQQMQKLLPPDAGPFDNLPEPEGATYFKIISADFKVGKDGQVFLEPNAFYLVTHDWAGRSGDAWGRVGKSLASRRLLAECTSKQTSVEYTICVADSKLIKAKPKYTPLVKDPFTLDEEGNVVTGPQQQLNEAFAKADAGYTATGPNYAEMGRDECAKLKELLASRPDVASGLRKEMVSTSLVRAGTCKVENALLNKQSDCRPRIYCAEDGIFVPGGLVVTK